MVKNFVPQDQEDFEKPLISELKDKTFLVVGVRFGNSSKGEYAIASIVTSDDPDDEPAEYRTSAKVVMQQLHTFAKEFKEEDEAFRVKLIEVKGNKRNYLTFDAPE